MGNQTKVTTVTLAGALATLLVFVAGLAWPEARMPAGLEAALATLITALVGWVVRA